MRKDLGILIDYAGLDNSDLLLSEKMDRLAMSPGAMLAFEERNLNYLTFDDFYGYKKFRVECEHLTKATDSFFSELDEKYKSVLGIPRPFKGNILWFLGLFADLLYLSRICDKINGLYNKVYMAGGPEYYLLFRRKMDFSSRGVQLAGLHSGLNNKVKLLNTILSPEYIHLAGVNPKPSLEFSLANGRIGSIMRKIPRKVWDLLNRSLLAAGKDLRKNAGKDSIFTIQDGFEVQLLKKYMPEFSFLSPLDKLLEMTRDENNHKVLKMIKDKTVSKLTLGLLFDKELEEFTNRWFQAFKKDVARLFSDYHDNVLCYAGSFMKKVEALFESHKPSALFYSICAHNIYQDLFAYFANKNNIPVFYFQHGGTFAFCKEPFFQYMEQNNLIDKINIYQSKVEGESLENGKKTQNRVFGSIKLYDFYHNCVEKYNVAGKKPGKIIYCTSPFSFHAYKNLVGSVGDKELFDINRDIIDVTARFNLNMDIKVHPAQEESTYPYFKRLAGKYNGKGSIKVLRGVAAEEIIKKYGLVILDYFGTALLPVAIIMNVPVMMYLKDASLLKEEVIVDIEKRFYLVKDKSDLERCIALYKRGELKSKFSRDIVDKYAFPLDSGNPGINIAGYIKTKISA